MIKKTIPYFSLAQIADSGQCFRLNRLPDGGFSLISQGRFLKLYQEKEEVSFYRQNGARSAAAVSE